ncbi:MAG TPA: hypothetical protein DCS92_20055 [Gammaproteobacteria bacterium]|nr:hypothetical protein [Gammaproteobacteria bacterium]
MSALPERFLMSFIILSEVFYMHFKKIGATLCLLTLSSINTALADGYLGLSYGTTSPDESGFEDDNGFKITGGGKLNDNFAVEVSYTDLGAFEMDRALVREIEYFVGYDLDGVDIEISGVEVSGMGIAPVNETLSLFGRIGIFLWDAELNVDVSGYGSGSDSDDGNDLFLGIGAMVNLSQAVSLKAEFSRYEAYEGDIDFMHLGFNVYF